MLKLYHTPISFNSRRVWIVLLEKKIPFELIPLKLDGDQFQPEFLAISPFHHIPVLVDGDFSLVESLAILDYLEAKYPTPTLLPNDAQSLGTVRMVEMVTLNELLPAMNPLIQQKMGFAEEDGQKLEHSKQQVSKVLTFFEQLLGDRPYFGSEHLTLAEVVAGTAVPILPSLGVSLNDYPKLRDWSKDLMKRDSWQQTQPSPEDVEAFKSSMETLMAKQNQ
ncbi:MAG: glutathione S-transferase family protein [Xenococcaceae cyanobacterium]